MSLFQKARLGLLVSAVLVKACWGECLAASSEDVIVLKPDDADGGYLPLMAEGPRGVCLPAGARRFANYSWKLPRVLEKGWWRMTLVMGPGEGRYGGQVLEIARSDALLPQVNDYMAPPYSFNLNEFQDPKKMATNTILVLLNASKDMVQVIKTGLIQRETVSILSITFTALEGPSELTGWFCVGLDLAGDKPRLEHRLPAGFYQLTIDRRLALTHPPIEWQQESGARGKVVAGYYPVRIYADSPIVALHGPASLTDFNLSLTHRVMPPQSLVSPYVAAPGLGRTELPIWNAIGDRQGAELLNVLASTPVVGDLGFEGDLPDGAFPEVPWVPYGKRIVILTSWDDGSAADLRLVVALQSRAIRGTFFLVGDCPMLKQIPLLTNAGFEIGAHTLTHPYLYSCTPEEAIEECLGCRRLLEHLANRPVISMAYPYGECEAFDCGGNYIAGAVRRSGFLSSRATYPGTPVLRDLKMFALPVSAYAYQDQRVVTAALEKAKETEDAVFHYMGHSWEIKDWPQFERTLEDLSHQKEAWQATQGELVLWLYRRSHLSITPLPSSDGRTVVRVSAPAFHSAFKVPLSLRLPEGARAASWNGKPVAAVNGVVNLE